MRALRKLWVGMMLAWAGCHKPAPAPPAPDHTVPVQLVTVQAAPFAPQFTARAEVFTLDDALLVAAQAGRVQRADFAPGSRVRAGQVLVQLETEALVIAQARARATLAMRRAAWSNSARRSERRHKARASSPDLVTPEALELSVGETAVCASELRVAAAEARAADLAVQQASIRAPRAGVMQSRDVLQGQHVAVGAILGRVAGGGTKRLRFYMPHGLAVDTPEGTLVQLSQLSQPPNGATARVTFVAASAEASTRQVEVHAVLQAGALDSLRPGSSVPVALQLPAREALTVPRSAVFPSETGMAVYVAQQGVAQLRPITLLPGQGSQVQVQSGLQAGESLVVTNLERLHPGAAIASSL